MSDFDKILQSKMEGFEPDVSPSVAEINRLNAGLDAMQSKRWGFLHYAGLLLLILLLLSQWWLLNSNWALNKKVEELTGLNKQVEIQDKKIRRAENLVDSNYLRSNRTNAALSKAQESQFLNKLNLMADAIQNLEHFNTQLLSEVSRLKKSINSQNISSINPSQVGKQSIITRIINDDKPLKEAPKKGKVTAIPKADTVIIKELVQIDSALYDSLVRNLEDLKKTTGQPVIKAPVDLKWQALLGIRPSYSNLYLVNGRLTLDVHIAAGARIADRVGINLGLKYKLINVHAHVPNINDPAGNLDFLPQDVYNKAKEIEGNHHGLLMPIDAQYFFHFGERRPFVRLCTDINLYSFDKYKIEYGTELYYPYQDFSRNVKLNNVALGLGNRFDLNADWNIEWEVGASLGQSLKPVIINEQNGIYVQFRLLRDL